MGGVHNATDPVDLSVFAWQLGGDYFNYQGSLTTPPCAEHVLWFVMKTPAVMSSNMIRFFPNAGNHRPVNALDGRTVLKSMLGIPPILPPPGPMASAVSI